MKKGKRFTISNVNTGDFSFGDDQGFNFDNAEPSDPFPGFDVPAVKYTGNQESDAADELRYVHDSLQWVDKHPPKTGDILDSPIFLTVVFESRSQLSAFLKDIGMFKYGDKYFSYLDWCNIFGIDTENGTSFLPGIEQQQEDNSFSFNLDTSFDFSDFGEKKTQKEEIGETLKNIRNDEKRTADYLAWAVDPSFWFCICFHTEKQKFNFQKSLGIMSERYAGFDLIWGHDFAKPFNMELEPCDFKPRIWSGKEDKRLMALLWNGEKE